MATLTEEKSPKEFLKSFKPIEVDIIASQGAGRIDYDIAVKTGGHGNGKDIKLGKDESYKVEFKLKRTPHDLDVRFDASAPIFVRAGEGNFCPTKLDGSEIMIDRCEDDELVIIDWNVDKVELHYQLNFVNWWGQQLNPYDPIILNGGGGTRPLY